MLVKEKYIEKHGEEAWKTYLEKKKKLSHIYYHTHRAKHTKSVSPPNNSRKAELNGYTYYVTEDGQHFYNAYGEERPVHTNKYRQNRRSIKLNQKRVPFSVIMANAFPEICGELFEGCEVHHIDGDTQNDCATNLMVLSKEEHHRLHDGIVFQYDKKGNFICKYNNSFEAAIAVGKPHRHTSIRQCINGKLKTSCGYIWKREL